MKNSKGIRVAYTIILVCPRFFFVNVLSSILISSILIAVMLVIILVGTVKFDDVSLSLLQLAADE